LINMSASRNDLVFENDASDGRRQIGMPGQTPGVAHGWMEIRHRMPASRPYDSSNDNLPHGSENLADAKTTSMRYSRFQQPQRQCPETATTHRWRHAMESAACPRRKG
jgi:hypothetical protein